MSSAGKSDVRPVRETPFTWRQRIAIWSVTTLATLLTRLVCSTLRYEVSAEDSAADAVALPAPATIAAFWHRSVIGAVYFFRNRGIAVMTSRSYDGEYVTRMNSNFGFTAVRGSSSRGAVAALIGMKKVIEARGVAAFASDGPRGPKYVAKPGPILLSKKTGAPIRCFYVAVSAGWSLRSWDEFVIPRPFARAHIRWSSEIVVPAEADERQMAEHHAQMQSALERVRDYAQDAVGSKL